MTVMRTHTRGGQNLKPSTAYVAAWAAFGAVALGYVGVVAGPFAATNAPWQVADLSSEAVVGPQAAVAGEASAPAPGVLPTEPVATILPPAAPVGAGPIVPTLLNGTTTDAPPPRVSTMPVVPAVPVMPVPPAIASLPRAAAPPVATGSLPKVQEYLTAAAPDAMAAPRPTLTTGSLPGLQPASAPAPVPLPKVKTLMPRTPVPPDLAGIDVPSAAPSPSRAVVVKPAVPTTATFATVIAPASVQPQAGPVGVLLGGDATIDEARARWAVTSAKSAALATLEPRVIATDALGSQSYRLVAGPIATRADAAKVCAELKAAGVACRIGGYAGAPF